MESQPPTRQAGGEGPLVHLSFTPLRLSLQWLFCEGDKPATCRTCHCMQKSSTAREGVGIATEAQPRWGQARRSFSHAAFQAKGHQCFHKCPLQTACSLGNKKKKMEYQSKYVMIRTPQQTSRYMLIRTPQQTAAITSLHRHGL